MQGDNEKRNTNWNLSVPYKLAQGPMSSIGQTVVKGMPLSWLACLIVNDPAVHCS